MQPILATAIDCDATKGGIMARTEAIAIAGHVAKAKAKTKAAAAPKKKPTKPLTRGKQKNGRRTTARSAADDHEKEEDEEEDEPGERSKTGRQKILFASACWLDNFCDCLNNTVMRIRLEKKWLLQVAKRFFSTHWQPKKGKRKEQTTCSARACCKFCAASW